MSISWGKSERFKFDASGQLIDWQPPSFPAVFAITYNKDPERPKSHTVLYFGQADNLAMKAPPCRDQVVADWKYGSNDERDLYVFVCDMSGATERERVRIKEQLVAEYSPPCNR